MGFVILLLFSKILRQMSEDGRRVAGSSFKGRDAAGAAPAISPFHSDHDVFVKETAVLQKPHGRFRREFVSAELANADEIAQPLGFLRIGKIQKWIEAVNFASGRWLSVLGQRFELGLDEFAQCAIFETFDDRSGSMRIRPMVRSPIFSAAIFTRIVRSLFARRTASVTVSPGCALMYSARSL